MSSGQSINNCDIFLRRDIAKLSRAIEVYMHWVWAKCYARNVKRKLAHAIYSNLRSCIHMHMPWHTCKRLTLMK